MTINLNAFGGCSLRTLIIGTGITSIIGDLDNKPTKVIWLPNTPPDGYSAAAGNINYVSNKQYQFTNSFDRTKVYPLLSSIFDVDGVTYVPVNMSERTCDAIDVVHNSSVENMAINSTVSYKGIAMTVKEVMPYTFYENNYVKTLSVDNAGNIGEYAFFGCDSLQTVTVSNQGEIGEDAFSVCLSLTFVILSESITNIKGNAFRRCSALTKMTIPNSILTLGDNCFYGCTSMQSVELGNGLTNIGRYAFGNCSALSSISIPSSVTNVGDYVFDDCTAMTKVVIEDRTETLSLGTNGSEPLFADCPLNSVYIGGKISYSTKSSDGYSPFYRNTSLESVVISDREDTVYDNEFYGCTGLKNVTIGNGVKSIGNWAFSGCSSLDKFSFGGNVESIGKEAFSDCTGMTQLISYAVTPPTCGAQALEDINKWECTLKVPESCKAAYQEADQWKDFLFTEDVLATQKYTLTYTVDGEVYHTESIALNAAIPTIEAPIKEGHTFNGWSELPTKMPAHDVTVEGSFTVNTYTITYKVDGKTYATEEVSYGSAITLKDAPEKEGHLFSGWSEVPETMPAHDVTVTGTFTVDGIEEIVTERLVDAYTLQGVIVKRQISVKDFETELPSGIYIVGGKKFVVK